MIFYGPGDRILDLVPRAGVVDLRELGLNEASSGQLECHVERVAGERGPRVLLPGAEAREAVEITARQHLLKSGQRRRGAEEQGSQGVGEYEVRADDEQDVEREG